MPHDWLRFAPELVRLNLAKARHARRLRARARAGVPGAKVSAAPAPCQSASDSGRAHETRCEACLSFDRATRYRRVCPALRLRADGAFCSLDSAEVRPAWGRVVAAFALPPLALFLCLTLGAWGVLRFGTGLERLSPLDVLWPPRWSVIAEQRRAHFHELALRAIAAGDPARANVALLSAAQIGVGDPAQNQVLARLATLGGYHSLADEIHARTLAAHPARAAELALAWHDDLLLAERPRQLARLALAQLGRADAPREFWLRAFFESIRHPGVSAELLASEAAATPPHSGLLHALRARAALDRRERVAASDELLAFEGLLPGQAARRFLAFSWRDAGDARRAREAALSTAHPAPQGEKALILHALFHNPARPEPARDVLRPLFSGPALDAMILAALVRDPDPVLLREYAGSLAEWASLPDETVAGLWLAARRAGDVELAEQAGVRLALPADLLAASPAPAGRNQLRPALGLLRLDRELLFALTDPR